MASKLFSSARMYFERAFSSLDDTGCGEIRVHPLASGLSKVKTGKNM